MIEFEVGDRVVELDTNEKGVVSRLCSDPGVVCVKRDISDQQEMIETKNLKKENGGRIRGD